MAGTLRPRNDGQMKKSITDSGVLSLIGGTPLLRLTRLIDRPDVAFYAKMELDNPGGSIKDRTAFRILAAALDSGELLPGDTVIESSSGNMAIGLAQACRYFALPLIVVVDPAVNRHTLKILRAYGAMIETVTEPFEVGGFLGARLARVQALLNEIPGSFWTNQYASAENPAAHYETMREIADALDGDLDYLFVATSTCGTIMGCARYIRDHGLSTKLIAVDAVGSVIFGTPPARRLIPGHGAGRPAQLLDRSLIDDVIHVDDWECVQGCRQLLAQEAILAGGSSGGAVMALQRYRDHFRTGDRVAFIVCDRGERYLDTIYSDDWVLAQFGELPPPCLSAAVAAAL